jgi:hypothetical protein
MGCKKMKSGGIFRRADDVDAIECSPSRRAFPMTVNLFPDLVACAVRIVGGERQLARYLGSETTEVEQWLKGVGEPPVPVYWRLSGLLARDINRYAASRPSSPVIRLGQRGRDTFA